MKEVVRNGKGGMRAEFGILEVPQQNPKERWGKKATRNQHYVFRAYLRPWAEHDLIYCLRKGRIFRPNLTGVACERFFYRFQDLSPKEIELVEWFFSDHPSESLKAALRNFMSLYFLPTALKRHLANGTRPEILSALDKVIAEGEEDYHQRVEDSLLVFLESMLVGNMDFYSDDEQSANFLYALCTQYMRTKQIREAVVNRVGSDFRGCNIRRMMSILAPLMAMAVSHGLYIDKNKLKLVLLDNDTDTPFLTADQPIINLQHTHSVEPPESLNSTTHSLRGRRCSCWSRQANAVIFHSARFQ